MSSRIPDSRKLRYIVAVARAGSFTGATQLLAITQSALTKSVAEMEAQLGYPLFERLPRGVRLTPAGEVFVEKAERILSDLSDLMLEMGEMADLQTGKLRIGVAPFAFVTFLDKSLPAFAAAYPGIQVEVRTGTVDEIARALINREVDVCIGATNYLQLWPDFVSTRLGSLSTFFVGRRDHPAGEDPDAATLLQYPVILPAAGLSTEVNLASAYHAAGLQPRSPHYVCDYFPLVLNIIAKTDAISPVVSQEAPGSRFRQGHSVYEGIISLEEHEIGYAVLRPDAVTPPAAVFLELFGWIPCLTSILIS
ncbi:MAG: LysR substrate-binding domain-containing protein, partial [Pseudomonadales bacterium]